jgi:hypothetical protein
MVNPVASPSFLRDAFVSFATYSNPQKQDVHKRALKWLQRHIEADLEDKTIMEQFTQKWRTGTNQPLSPDKSPLYLEKLPGSYKGSSSINAHQEDALVFLHSKVPQELQDDFKKHWDVKIKLEVSNSSGTQFKVDERETTVLQQQDPNGDGTTWYQVNNKQIYYLLSSEPKGDHYIVVLSEEIGPQNRNTWFVCQEHVKVSKMGGDDS